MNTYMRKIEVRGARYKEICDYFKEILVCEKSGDEEEIYVGGHLHISIVKGEKVKLGTLEFPSTFITFKGEQEIVIQSLAAFRRAFLTAGG